MNIIAISLCSIVAVIAFISWLIWEMKHAPIVDDNGKCIDKKQDEDDLSAMFILILCAIWYAETE